MRHPDIELVDQEEALLEQIQFAWRDHAELRASLEPMADLARRLLDRNAIPERRLRYFTDPACNPGGRGKSRLDVFERNGTAGDALLTHPHFLKYLEFFVCGANFPATVKQDLLSSAGIAGHLTSEDVSDFIPKAKAIARAASHPSAELAEEFFKLALDCDATPSAAAMLRSAVRTVRR